MKYYTMPANFKKEIIEMYQEFNYRYNNTKIFETYGQLTEGDIVNSGRASEALPIVGLNELEQYIRLCSDTKIEFNYTFNAACLGNLEFSMDGLKRIKSFIGDLKSIGVTSYTVASPAIIEIIREVDSDSKIVVSAISEVNSVSKALFYKKLKVNRIVFDADINRNFNVLRNIIHVCDIPFEIIINNLCYRDCAYKMFHYNHDSHISDYSSIQNSICYYPSRCALQKYEFPENILKLNWIRPEDIKYYEDIGIHYYKVQGRPNTKYGDPLKMIEAYATENYEGNLCELLLIFSPSIFSSYIDNKKLDGFIDGFMQNVCTENCTQCNYCSNYAKKAMNYDEAIASNRTMISIFESQDLFSTK